MMLHLHHIGLVWRRPLLQPAHDRWRQTLQAPLTPTFGQRCFHPSLIEDVVLALSRILVRRSLDDDLVVLWTESGVKQTRMHIAERASKVDIEKVR